MPITDGRGASELVLATVRVRDDSAQSLHRSTVLRAIGRELSHAPFPPLMTDNTPKHGRCPECDEDISAAYIFIEYEKDDGTTGIWAECPTCGDVVNPATE